MNRTVNPNQLKGTVKAPASKSAAHRALFLAAFADSETLIRGAGRSEDIQATLRALEVLGAGVKESEGELTVRPVSMQTEDDKKKLAMKMKLAGMPPETRKFDCGESGSTFRFTVPLVGIDGVITEFRLHGRLPERPMRELLRELSKKGMAFDQMGHAFTAQGKLRGGTFRLPGNVSSQFISALLMAAPLLSGESRIEVEGPVSSQSYVELTLDMIRRFGGKTEREDNTFTVEPICVYHSPGEVNVEGDWSSAAFWLTACALGADICVEGLDENSIQGDRAVRGILPRILAGDCSIDIDACPDLLPVLSAAAAVSPGTTVFTGAERLRDKESDRLEAAADMINALGGHAAAEGGQLTVEGCGGPDGPGKLRGGTVDACGDHRIAMSAAVVSCACEGPVTILGAECTAKSYPDFWDDFRALGGETEES